MIKIVSEQTKYHRFALYYDYDYDKVEFCRSLKENFGWDRFSFDSQGPLKRWVFSESLFVPVLVEKFPEVEIEGSVRELVEHEQKWHSEKKEKEDKLKEIKVQDDTNFKIKGLKKELYAYQKVGVEFIDASGGRAIVADGMGLGKTCQALAYVKHSKFPRTLVVCPASVKFSWEGEIKKWTNMSSTVIDSKTDLSEIDAKTNVWIINYDILKKHFNELSKTRFDCIIGDECQLIKSPKAIRTKAFRAISRSINSIVLLSGTPLLSRPSELFSLLNIIDPSTWNNWYDFARKYCAMKQTRWGVDTSGASNIEELHSRIKSYFIRRDKSQVLKELPPKSFINVPIQLEPKLSRVYSTAANDLATYLRRFAGKQPPEIAKSMAAEKLTQLNVLRRINALGKTGTATELVESIINSDEKVLVFCSFIEPLEKLKEKFGDSAVILTGQTKVEDRRDIVESFQNDKNVKVFLGGYKSAGVGITLTAASNFIGMDYPWNPADLQQAIDRLHRPGQKANAVNIYQLSAINTIDEDMKDTLDRKQGIFDQIIEGKEAKKTEKDVMASAVERVLRDF